MSEINSQTIEADDIAAVVEVLQSKWLTTGPKVNEFESEFKNYVGTEYAIAVSSGTAALHTSMYAIGIKAGDEVIVPSLTFIATANAVVYMGGVPVFIDVCHDTLLIDLEKIEKNITKKTKAIIAVDYAGQPCDYNALNEIAKKHSLVLVADACHSLGAKYQENLVGSQADITVFSFHPVKAITTGEGGMAVTSNKKYAERMKKFRNHNIDIDHHERAVQESWQYSISDLGFNYRLSDIQCALGISQLRKLPEWLKRRRAIAVRYSEGIKSLERVLPLVCQENIVHAYHFYVIRLLTEKLRLARKKIFKTLRSKGIGVNVHYIPVHLQPFYQNIFSTQKGLCPVAEQAYEEILSLPIHPQLKDENVETILSELENAIETIL